MQLEKISKALKESREGIETLQKNNHFLEVISNAANLISHTIKKDSKIFSCGNGGSMCDAMHFAEELSGRFRENRELYHQSPYLILLSYLCSK